jgi:hypothetical protein
MSRMENQKVINLNSINPLSPTLVNPSGCSKIIPHKSTFLKTNQIITKYAQEGNVRYHQTNEMGNYESDFVAYEACET